MAASAEGTARSPPYLRLFLPSLADVITFYQQTIGASFFLKQWGPYNVAIWVSFAQFVIYLMPLKKDL